MAELFEPVPENGRDSHAIDVDPFNPLNPLPPRSFSGDTAQVADVNSQASAPKSYPRLRTRGRLTDYQKNVLERLFARSPYLTSNQCVEVAAVLGIPKPALQNWFKNKRYRMKLKKESQKNVARCITPALMVHCIQNSGPVQNICGEAPRSLQFPYNNIIPQNCDQSNSFLSAAASSAMYN